MALSPELRRRNLRLAAVLVSVVLVFALGFVARMLWFGH